MTIWDTIYQNKKKNNDVWSTPSDKFFPNLEQFLKLSKFKQKHVLDIGCGTGKYLKVLQAEGFQTDGLDSSELAVKMTKELLADASNIQCADMFRFDMPTNKYDLIISILTIHHGTKKQVQDLLTKIHKALVAGGKIFITLPDFNSNKEWGSFKDSKKISPSTFIPLSGPEKGLTHSYYTKVEIQKLLSKFNKLKLKIDADGDWLIIASK